MRDVLYLLIPVLGGVAAGSVALYASDAGFPAGPKAGNVNLAATLILIAFLLGFLFYGLRRHPEVSARLIVSGITVAGTISGLILFKVSLQAIGISPGVFLLALPLGYVGLNWSVRGYFGLLSPRRASALMAGSATLLGALIGTSLPSIFSIVFLGLLTIVDVTVVESNAIPNVVGKISYDRIVSSLTLPLEKYLIGIGDFLAYSILASSSLYSVGISGAIATSILILLGSVITLEITKVRKKTPGLLLPVGLGLIPLIIGGFHL